MVTAQQMKKVAVVVRNNNKNAERNSSRIGFI